MTRQQLKRKERAKERELRKRKAYKKCECGSDWDMDLEIEKPALPRKRAIRQRLDRVGVEAPTRRRRKSVSWEAPSCVSEEPLEKVRSNEGKMTEDGEKRTSPDGPASPPSLVVKEESGLLSDAGGALETHPVPECNSEVILGPTLERVLERMCREASTRTAKQPFVYGGDGKHDPSTAGSIMNQALRMMLNSVEANARLNEITLQESRHLTTAHAQFEQERELFGARIKALELEREQLVKLHAEEVTRMEEKHGKDLQRQKELVDKATDALRRAEEGKKLAREEQVQPAQELQKVEEAERRAEGARNEAETQIMRNKDNEVKRHIVQLKDNQVKCQSLQRRLDVYEAFLSRLVMWTANIPLDMSPQK